MVKDRDAPPVPQKVMGDQALDFQERFHRVHSALLQSLRPSSNPWVPAPWDLLPESNFSHPYDSFLKS